MTLMGDTAAKMHYALFVVSCSCAGHRQLLRLASVLCVTKYCTEYCTEEISEGRIKISSCTLDSMDGLRGVGRAGLECVQYGVCV